MEVGFEGTSLLSRRTFPKNYFIHMDISQHPGTWNPQNIIPFDLIRPPRLCGPLPNGLFNAKTRVIVSYNWAGTA